MAEFHLADWTITSKVISRVMGGGEVRRNVIDSVYFVDGEKSGTREFVTSLPVNATHEQVETELKQHLGIAD